MGIRVKDIWIEAEEWAEGEWDYNNDNTDVIVTTDDNRKFVGSFFTYSNIEQLRMKNQSTGENLSGKWLWGSDMILIDKCSREDIEIVINDLIKEDYFESAFEEFFDDEED